MRRAVLIALLPLALVACKPEAAPRAGARPVVSEIVSPRAGLQASYAGTVAARTETDLGFPLAGTLAERPVEEGDVVEKGATLALIDPQELDAEVRAAEAGVRVAQAQLSTAQDAARRADALVARGVDSPATAEATHSALITAQAQLAQARASRAQARELRGFATLSAPMAGVITHVYVQPGASLTPGQPVVRLAATGDREVLIDLSEQDAAGLAPGAEFRIALEAAPQVASTATLRLIDPVADPATRTRRLHLTLAPDAPAPFRLGALVMVAPDARTQAQLTLPVTALIGGLQAVWVVDPQTRTVHRQTVTLGPRAGDRVLIRGGLKPGQEVVTKGVNSIKGGQHVGPRVPA